MRNLFSIYLWIALLPVCLMSQQTDYRLLDDHYNVEQLTAEQGLSDNFINHSLQDQQGFLWFATNDGLNRFDGYSFKVFKNQRDDSTSLSHNTVNYILEDRAGKVWVATNGGLNLYDPITESFQRFTHDPSNSQSIGHNQIKTMYEDRAGVLWLGTFAGLNKMDAATQTFQLYQHELSIEHLHGWIASNRQDIKTIQGISDEQMLLGYWGVGPVYFNKKTETFRVVPIQEEHSFDYATTDWISPIKDGKAWVVMRGTLFRFIKGEGLIQALDISREVSFNLVGFILLNSGHYLSLSHNGVYLLDENFQAVQHLLPEANNPLTPIHNWVTSFIIDRAGDYWFGSGGSGIFHLNTQKNRFGNFPYLSGNTQSVKHHLVSAILEVEENVFWVATRRHGMNIFHKNENRFSTLPEHIAYPNGLSTPEISALHKDSKGNIWIGSWGRGVMRYRPDDQSFQHYKYDQKDTTTIYENFVRCIYETTEGEIWIGTIQGVSILANAKAIEDGTFIRRKPEVAKPTANLYVHTIQQTRDGHIWLGTDQGLFQYDVDRQDFVSFSTIYQQQHHLSHITIDVLYEGKDGILWIGAREGLYAFNPATSTLIHFSQKEGLADLAVTGIQEDEQANLWVATKTGLTKYDPASGLFKNYNSKDGLLNRSINKNAFALSQDGEMILCGGQNGLSTFCPDDMYDNTYLPPVVITSLHKYDNTQGEVSEASIPGMPALEEIILSYRDNIITFGLSALNFRNADKNQFAYQLEGFDDHWINMGNKREITFTNLDPGQYTLQVKASNNDGLWNQEVDTLVIHITPPWWASWWAYTLYLGLFITIVSTILAFLRRRFLLQNALKQEQEEANRLKELDTFKSRLYTNLTHEFRTPLTVILGMVDQIRNQPKKYLDEGTQLIERNGQNLLRLINQLLDLSKLENKSFQLSLQQGDIIRYLRYITESFQTYANSNNLSLRFFCPSESLYMDYDPEQIKQVMTNLISNAIKYTSSNGEIKVRVTQEQEHLQVDIQDSGVGIAAKDLPYIFNRFYQADNSTTRKGEGTGIGLAHSQELVRLMGGTIHAKSELGKGSSFQFRLPIRKEAVMVHSSSIGVDIPAAPFAKAKKEPTTVNGDRPHILLIEDNPDVVVYLQACLEDTYQIDVAYNGKIGIETAVEKIPDIIISDVMMPEKDGYEVCDTLKHDERTSHIPIILLTAKADTSSKIKGLRRGADAYLSKPFNKEELLIRLQALIEKQKNLVAYFSRQLQDGFAQKTDQSNTEEAIIVEDVFIQKVRQIVAAHFSDEDFALPQLCQKIGMSRSQLFRKMKALIDVSPSQFIRSYRLQHAKMLLETSDLTVSEVAWQVGFKDLAHFSRSFQEAFGDLPSAITKTVS